MAIIIPEGYAQVIIGFSSATFDGGEAALVLGFGGELGDDPTSLEDFAAAVALAWGDAFGAILDNNIAQVGVQVIGPTTSAFYPSNQPGSFNGELAPPNVAVLVNKTSSRRGRRARGRSFIPGLAYESQIDERGFLVTGHRQAIQTACDQFIADLTDPVVPGVAHVILQGDEGVTPPISPPPVVTAWTVQPLVSTQRRRLRR